MLRLRRRFGLILCGACLLIFLALYFIISYTAPSSGENNPSFGAIESKLLQLENGLQRHGQEMRHLKNRLQQQWQAAHEPQNDVNLQQQSFSNIEQKNELGSALDDAKKCSIDMQQAPQQDIQMLELYNKLTFADVDGGVWKQGWNINYDPLRYNDHHKLRVFVVPHSHNDPGWIKTVDDYYEHDTKHILSNALRHLREHPDMKFIWAEIVYFARFYEDLGQQNKLEMKKLVQNRQFEFVTGGWVMPDEANSHWRSVLLQLTEGHTWLKQYLNVTPTSSWSIDPFGYSPTLPYILKKSGFENLLIQRTHYSVKKELAQQRQLEFYWRQLWDETGTTEIFTHMMPFYSYDVPHTCGPDPKICCQFDFKRTPLFGLTCPWRVSPQQIDDHNVAQRSELLVDQWKKKAELYRTNALLIPLGDDFRYSQSTEWDVQRVNYEKLFDHINSERKYFVEAKFATLQEYFDEVHKQQQQREFPTLSGDFFTYADRADNYWSGYFTSRPYHKRMERVLLHYVFAAELLHAWNSWPAATKFQEMLQTARRELSLFQHHDGIAGTAKTHVMLDYMRRMTDAVKACKFVMQQSVYRLLTKETIYNADYKFNYFYLDDSRWPGPDDSRTTIILGDELPSRHVVFHNALPRWREELVEFYVSSPFISVSDLQRNPVHAQVSPVWTWHRHTLSKTITPQASTTKYRLVFKVRVPPLGLITYLIHIESADAKPAYTSYATNLILTTSPFSVNPGEYPSEVNFGKPRELTLRVGTSAVAFSIDGHLKSIQLNEHSPHMPIHLKFLKYGVRPSGDRSGAYLFLPNGPAEPLVQTHSPVVLVVQGQLEASVSVGLPYAIHQTVLNGGAPEIRNLVDIGEFDDTEVVMRFSTHIQSNDTFYTDLNGLQMIKRKRFAKLPLQANVYPVPTAIYIEDTSTRLTVVSAQPLGGTSLAQGEIELLQDRRLIRDDERGLGQGVLDNQPVLNIFRIVLEKIDTCVQSVETHPAGALTLSAYRSMQQILHPVDRFIFIGNDWLGVQSVVGGDRTPADEDIEVVAVRNLGSDISGASMLREHNGRDVVANTGVILHRTNLVQCDAVTDNRSPSEPIHLLKLIKNADWIVTAINRTTLTFLQTLQRINVNSEAHSFCAMDTQAFVLQRRKS